MVKGIGGRSKGRRKMGSKKRRQRWQIHHHRRVWSGKTSKGRPKK